MCRNTCGVHEATIPGVIAGPGLKRPLLLQDPLRGLPAEVVSVCEVLFFSSSTLFFKELQGKREASLVRTQMWRDSPFKEVGETNGAHLRFTVW